MRHRAHLRGLPAPLSREPRLRFPARRASTRCSPATSSTRAACGWIAARGDAAAVGLLTRLMASCSYLRSVGAPFAATTPSGRTAMGGLGGAARRRVRRHRRRVFDDLTPRRAAATPSTSRAGRAEAPRLAGQRARWPPPSTPRNAADRGDRPAGRRAPASRRRAGAAARRAVRPEEADVDLRRSSSCSSAKASWRACVPRSTPISRWPRSPTAPARPTGPALLFEQPSGRRAQRGRPCPSS